MSVTLGRRAAIVYALIDWLSVVCHLEGMIALYCQSLRLSSAQNLFELFVEQYKVSRSSTTDLVGESFDVKTNVLSQFAAIYVYLSRAYSLVGNGDKSSAYEELGRNTIKKAKSNILFEAMKASSSKGASGDSINNGTNAGSNNNTSVLFQQHRFVELLRDCDLILSE